VCSLVSDTRTVGNRDDICTFSMTIVNAVPLSGSFQIFFPSLLYWTPLMEIDDNIVTSVNSCVGNSNVKIMNDDFILYSILRR
jgi:hypothetical protein